MFDSNPLFMDALLSNRIIAPLLFRILICVDG